MQHAWECPSLSGGCGHDHHPPPAPHHGTPPPHPPTPPPHPPPPPPHHPPTRRNPPAREHMWGRGQWRDPASRRRCTIDVTLGCGAHRTQTRPARRLHCLLLTTRIQAAAFACTLHPCAGLRPAQLLLGLWQVPVVPPLTVDGPARGHHAQRRGRVPHEREGGGDRLEAHQGWHTHPAACSGVRQVSAA